MLAVFGAVSTALPASQAAGAAEMTRRHMHVWRISRMNATTGTRRAAGGRLVGAVLLLARALGACARGGQNGGNFGNTPPTQQTTTGGQNNSNAAAAAVATADVQMQALLSALDAAQSAATTDLSSQDIETQP